MAKKSSPKNAGPVSTVGIDLAKNSFHVHGTDDKGHTVINQKISRKRLPQVIAQLSQCTIAMEACGSAHYWARVFSEFGHEVKLIAPQFVKPFVKSNKNDAADAEAISEAAQRPNMRFVSPKSVEQQDIQSIHRMRSLAISQRTALVNQIRGLLLEYGIDIPKGRRYVMQRLPEILGGEHGDLSPLFLQQLQELYDTLNFFDERIDKYDTTIKTIAEHNENVQNLMTIPGLGPIIATALAAAVGEHADVFKNGRELAAWIGLVPRQHSTGGRDKLLGISKRGDVYLRTLMIHGARSIMRHAGKQKDKLREWGAQLIDRRNMNVAVVAMANKLARIAHAVLTSGQPYNPNIIQAQSAA